MSSRQDSAGVNNEINLFQSTNAGAYVSGWVGSYPK